MNPRNKKDSGQTINFLGRHEVAVHGNRKRSKKVVRGRPSASVQRPMDVVVHLGTCAIYVLWDLELARCPLDHAHEPILDLFMILGRQTPKVANDAEGKPSRETMN